MTTRFPKVLKIRGVEVLANSWEELDELVARYGTSPDELPAPDRSPDHPMRKDTTLSQSDRDLLGRFVEAAERGVLVNDIRDALDRTGKVGSALKAWSATIGLTKKDGTSPFEGWQRSDGRVHRLTNESLQAARALLAR